MTGMINSGQKELTHKIMRCSLNNTLLIKIWNIVSDEAYDSRNKIMYHCDKSAINKHVNRLATLNV